MEMIGFRLDEETLEKLKEVARKERRPLSNLVRMIVEDWLEDYGRTTRTVTVDFDDKEVVAVHEKQSEYKPDK